MAIGTERRKSESAATTATIVLVVVLVLAGLFAFFSGTSARNGPAAAELPVGRESVSTPLAAGKPAGLKVPSVGIDAASVIDLGFNEDRSLETPKDAKSIGWFTRGAGPGVNGPAVFASHVNYGGVEGGFADLSELEPGDQVQVPRTDGVTAVYVVDRIDQVAKNSFPTAQVYGPTTRPEIRLITCGGDFDSDTRHYEDNVVVYGHLTEAFRP